MSGPVTVPVAVYDLPSSGGALLTVNAGVKADDARAFADLALGRVIAILGRGVADGELDTDDAWTAGLLAELARAAMRAAEGKA